MSNHGDRCRPPCAVSCTWWWTWSRCRTVLGVQAGGRGSFRVLCTAACQARPTPTPGCRDSCPAPSVAPTLSSHCRIRCGWGFSGQLWRLFPICGPSSRTQCEQSWETVFWLTKREDGEEEPGRRGSDAALGRPPGPMQVFIFCLFMKGVCSWFIFHLLPANSVLGFVNSSHCMLFPFSLSK